jgi:hypothetical protein
MVLSALIAKVFEPSANEALGQGSQSGILTIFNNDAISRTVSPYPP